ncbi:MAG: hypothetical protein COB54_05470 [Alphaproteobacteria bacterium]|nr:MAG: hypothetical protein COB54_05470 [Alphaproteobacteria bacterium]
MTHIHHTLAEEFSEHLDKMHNMKLTNQYFVNLHEKYDKANEEINQIESGLEPTSDIFLEDLKKKRLVLKDEIYTLITA